MLFYLEHKLLRLLLKIEDGDASTDYSKPSRHPHGYTHRRGKSASDTAQEWPKECADIGWDNLGYIRL